MAEVFMNYYHPERERAERIASALERLGHVPLLLKPGEQWRSVVPRKLYECDAVVALLTPGSIMDEWTTLERGMAVGIQLMHQRGTIIPVVLEDGVEIPQTLRSDYAPVHGAGMNDEQIAVQIAVAISKRTPTAKIFITHSHADKGLADALRNTLEQALETRPESIRVTSLIGGKLPIGATISEALRRDLEESRVVLGIVTPHSLRSEYVLFELGASWGLQKPTYPLLAGPTTIENLPGPLKEREAINLADAAACHGLIDQLQKDTNIARKAGEGISSRVAEAISRLTRAAQDTEAP
jgi:nucleoside 2-deoxyribosyltransferase